MAETIDAGGISHRLEADITPFADAMRAAEEKATQAGKAMGDAFERAGVDAGAAIDRFVTDTMQKAATLIVQLGQHAGKLNEVWSNGAEGAEKAVASLFESTDAALDGFASKVASKGGVYGKAFGIAWEAGLGELTKGAVSGLKPMVAGWLDSLLGSDAVKGALESFSSAFQSAAVSTLGSFGGDAAEEWASGFNTALENALEGARTALQRIAGTLDEITAAGKKAIDFLEQQNKHLERTYNLQGLTKEEAIRTAAWMDAIAKTGKTIAELSAADLQAINEKIERQIALTKTIDAQKEAEKEVAEVMREDLAIRRQAAREAESFADSYDRQIKQANLSLQERIESYELEIALIGKTTGEVAALKLEQEALNRARRQDLPAPDAELLDLAKRRAQDAAIAKEQWKALEDAGRAVTSNLEKAFAEFTRTGKLSVKEMVDSMLQDLARLAFRSALANLFGSFAGGGSGTGLIGAAASSFGGFKAEGGPLDQGKWYIAGEHGPEPIWGGGAGAFAAGYGNGGGGGPTEITMRVDLAGANGDETIRRIVSQAAQATLAKAMESNKAMFATNQRSARMLTA